MKTSFYFVLWIIIYPLLGLLHNEFISNNSFFVALILIWVLSWFLNRNMPDTLRFERMSTAYPILEDVYKGNVVSFMKNLGRRALTETVMSLYFCLAVVVILATSLRGGSGIFELVIFGFFAIGIIVNSSRLVNAYFRLKRNPTPDECALIAEDTYKLNYTAYYEQRQGRTYANMFPPRPGSYKGFLVFSAVVAVIAVVLGVITIIFAVITSYSYRSVDAGIMSSMYFLYGGLAVYFGLRDLLSCLRSLKTDRSLTQ